MTIRRWPPTVAPATPENLDFFLPQIGGVTQNFKVKTPNRTNSKQKPQNPKQSFYYNKMDLLDLMELSKISYNIIFSRC